MDTEHRFKLGDAVRFNGEIWMVRNFLGNRIYSLMRSGKSWSWEFAYETEMEPMSTEDLLQESIAQAKAKRQPGE